MALAKQVISIPFTGGLDTKTDEKLVAQGSMTAIQDGIYTKAATVNKRNGYLALSNNISGGGVITSATDLMTYKNELLLTSNNELYSWSPQNNVWIDKGPIYNTQVSEISVAQNQHQMAYADVAINSNIAVYTWYEFLLGTTFGVFASVVDIHTGVSYQSYTSIDATGHSPKLCSVGANIILFWVNSGTLNCKVLNPAAPQAFGATIPLHAGLASNSALLYGMPTWYDVMPTTGANAVLVYNNSPVHIEYIDQNGVTSSNTTLVTDANYGLTLAIDPSNGDVYVVKTNSPDLGATQTISYEVVDNTFTVQLADTLIQTADHTGIVTCLVTSPGNAQVIFEEGPTADNNRGVSNRTLTKLGIVGGLNTINVALGIAGNPFLFNGVPLIPTRNQSLNLEQDAYFLIDINDNVLGKALPQSASPFASWLNTASITATQPFRPTSVSHTIVGPNSTFINALGVLLPGAGSALGALNGIDSVTWSLNPLNNHTELEANGVLLINGGFPQLYDGVNVTENGFHTWPIINFVNQQAGAGGFTGTFVFYAVYEWHDNQGNFYQSAPSDPFTFVVTGSCPGFTINVETLKITNKVPPLRSNVNIAIYRTQSNGVIPYQATDALIANNKGADNVTTNTTMNDAAIANDRILYTTGGVIENIMPYPSQVIDHYKDRIVMTQMEDPLTVWYSKTIVPGEGISFNDAFVIDVDPLGGAVTAVKSMDDKLIIFKDAFIFVTAGDGPLDTGQQSTLAIPLVVNTDIGCPYPRSIIRMPIGLMFKSLKGIYLLDRSLQSQYVGAPVEQYNSQDIQSVDLIVDKNQVRFLTSAGVTLVYDYFFNKWTTFTNHTGFDSTIWQNVYSYVRNNGIVYTENNAVFTDAGAAITLIPTSAWIKINSIEGYQRTRRAEILGNYFTPHTLTIKVYYDYNDNLFDTYTFSTALSLIPPDNVYQFRIHLRKQKCEAIKFEFDDAITMAPGQGYSINDISLEIGIKAGVNKLPAIKSG